MLATGLNRTIIRDKSQGKDIGDWVKRCAERSGKENVKGGLQTKARQPLKCQGRWSEVHYVGDKPRKFGDLIRQACLFRKSIYA